MKVQRLARIASSTDSSEVRNSHSRSSWRYSQRARARSASVTPSSAWAVASHDDLHAAVVIIVSTMADVGMELVEIAALDGLEPIGDAMPPGIARGMGVNTKANSCQHVRKPAVGTGPGHGLAGGEIEHVLADKTGQDRGSEVGQAG